MITTAEDPQEWNGFQDLEVYDESQDEQDQEGLGLMTYTAEEDSVLSTDLDDVDRRLEVAMYYREFLRGEMFEDRNDSSMVVEEEVRQFVKQRLGVLLGVEVESAKSMGFQPSEVEQIRRLLDFSQEEILALKTIAARVLQKPLEAPKLATKAKPTPSIQAKPLATKPAIRRQRPTPAGLASKPAARPAMQAKQNAKPQGKIVVGTNQKGQRMTQIGEKKYVLATNELGGEYVQDVTPVPTNPNRIPMPATSAHFAAAMEANAQASVNAFKLPDVLTVAAVNAITTTDD